MGYFEEDSICYPPYESSSLATEHIVGMGLDPIVAELIQGIPHLKPSADDIIHQSRSIDYTGAGSLEEFRDPLGVVEKDGEYMELWVVMLFKGSQRGTHVLFDVKAGQLQLR